MAQRGATRRPARRRKGKFMATELNVAVVTDSTGKWTVNEDSWAHAYTYNGSNQMVTDTVVDPINGYTFVRTYTYTGGNLTNDSGWVKQ
jgi:hypothetical protein